MPPHSQSWEKAFEQLTNIEREILKKFGINNTKSLTLEIETIERLKDGCTKNLTPGVGDKKPIITRARIHNILKKMQKYVIIGDIAIQQNPDIIALVWAGVRFCLKVPKTQETASILKVLRAAVLTFHRWH